MYSRACEVPFPVVGGMACAASHRMNHAALCLGSPSGQGWDRIEQSQVHGVSMDVLQI